MPNLVMKINFNNTQSKSTQNKKVSYNTQQTQIQNKNISLMSVKQSSRSQINSMFQKIGNGNGGGGCGCGR